MSFYFPDKERKVGMERRLSAREANPVDPIPGRMETDKNIFQWNGSILLGMEDETVVVAIRTTEITAREEKYRADSPLPIRERGLQESFDLDHFLES
jgi:hypothetical protein